VALELHHLREGKTPSPTAESLRGGGAKARLILMRNLLEDRGVGTRGNEDPAKAVSLLEKRFGLHVWSTRNPKGKLYIG